MRSFLWAVLLGALWGAPQATVARQTLEFHRGEKFQVIADVAYQMGQKNRLQVIGNVIITQGDRALYGEKANVDLASGQVEVEGNVRYVATGLTIYGSFLKYNIKTQAMFIEHARVISPHYTVVGKKLSGLKSGHFVGEEAEYTTCQDCPESWSFFGDKIEITEGQYIHIRNAQVKIKGVVVFYLPYLVLPIKKKRESGLLFPSIGLNFARGVRYQQPIYLVLSDQSDLTVTPSTWGLRGLGGEAHLQHFFNQTNWVSANSIFADDQVYEPFKRAITPSGQREFRHFSSWEQHFTRGAWLNHHGRYQVLSDLDFLRDFDFYTLDKVIGSEVGGEGFLGLRSGLFAATISAAHYQNTLFDRPRHFDDRYVQILPRIQWAMAPVRIFQSQSFPLSSAFLEAKADWTYFRQRTPREQKWIRNAQRANINPQLLINFNRLGPVDFKAKVQYGHQIYRFPTRPKERAFEKRALSYETEAFVEVDKTFDMSPTAPGPIPPKPQMIDQGQRLVGGLKKFWPHPPSPEVEVISNSYQHSQTFRLKHFFLSHQRDWGSPTFAEQIQWPQGHFDRTDVLKGQEFQLSDGLEMALPLSNTLELRWENVLIKRAPRATGPHKAPRSLLERFRYSQVADFHVSQGFDLKEDRPTRLLVEGGVSLDQFRLRGREYYFHDTYKHIFELSLGVYQGVFDYEMKYKYDTGSTPVRNLGSVSAKVAPSDFFSVMAGYDYNLFTKRMDQTYYELTYLPRSDCWKLVGRYSQNLIESRLAVNIFVRLGGRGLKSLSDFD